MRRAGTGHTSKVSARRRAGAAPKPSRAATTYKSAGVDIESTDAFVSSLPGITAPTMNAQVLSSFKAFAGMFRLDLTDITRPVLVVTTDGVGTKLKIAQMMGRHDTIGIDLVAMSVNDLITCGARPLVFLDYLATGKFRNEEATAILGGIVKGCREGGMVLIGGETAEMPGFYRKGEYDLAGFAAGIADEATLVDPRRIAPGDVVLGISSSGLHSNGYSLARKVLLDQAGLSLDGRVRGLGSTLGEALLTPTRIYVDVVRRLRLAGDLHAIAHITGGGLPDNLRRLLPPGCRITLDARAWKIPPIFTLIQKRGNVSTADMRRTFNMGIGLALVAARDQVDLLQAAVDEPLTEIGYVEEGEGDVTIR